MKLKNIKDGMKIQHKKTGEVYEVKRDHSSVFIGFMVGLYMDSKERPRYGIWSDRDAKLFRIYKEQ